MHIFKLKEGSKSFEWVKDVIEKEPAKCRILRPHPQGDTLPVNSGSRHLC